MPDKYIEKSFLYLLVLSLVIHLGIFAGIYYLPQEKQPPPKEPVFIDLQPAPDLKTQEKPRQNEVKRFSDRRQRVAREMAPRGRDAIERLRPPPAPRPSPSTPRQGKQSDEQPSAPRESAQDRSPAPLSRSRERAETVPGSSVSSLLKPKASGQPQLFPSAKRMAKLEESYRRKFEEDIAVGDTKFLNSEDILFGSFLRRFKDAVYGVWRYPQEAAMKGIEGITPVRITFNREGKITQVKVLESSGARILDEEVLRTLRVLGPMGAFPKGYDKDEFHLIAFFQYGGARRALR